MQIRLVSFLLALFFLSLFACQNTEKSKAKSLTKESKEVYLKKGKSIAAKSFTALSGALQKAMQNGGVSNAMQYCKMQAILILDSLSTTENAIIRRTSLQVRNPSDAPTASELKILNQYHKADASNQEIKPIVEQLANKRIAFYAPIRVNEFCLQCHGKLGETLTEENYAFIKNNYPNDAAIGYKAGDLRGMWSIEFINN